MAAIASKILLCLLVAFLIGLLTGWLIWAGAKRLAAEWEAKYKKVSDEKEEMRLEFRDNEEKLNASVKELKVAQGDLASVKTELEGHNSVLEEWKTKYSALEGDYSTAKSKISELSAAAAAGGAAGAVAVSGGSGDGEEVRTLTLQLERCRARYLALQEKSSNYSIRLAELEAKTGEVEAPGWLLTEMTAGREKDNLQEIKGVGPVMEETLNKLGIYYFDQLAQMSPRDVAWISTKIETFPDRIFRDKWVEQADEFAKKQA